MRRCVTHRLCTIFFFFSSFALFIRPLIPLCYKIPSFLFRSSWLLLFIMLLVLLYFLYFYETYVWLQQQRVSSFLNVDRTWPTLLTIGNYAWWEKQRKKTSIPGDITRFLDNRKVTKQHKGNLPSPLSLFSSFAISSIHVLLPKTENSLKILFEI